MRRREPRYPLIPKSTSALIPGQYWALPLSDGSFGCGRVIQLMPAGTTGSRVTFLAGVLDWHGGTLPTVTAISGASCLAQGAAHVRSIVLSGGCLLGWRELAADGIEPWLFRGAEHWRNSVVQQGFAPIRPQTPDDVALPVYETWGLEVARLVAERRFVAFEAAE
jgi:hypothetical protein